ncbi:MAG TPA: lytic murein transglycosylase, partial [Solirubrobacteraceae bacterium]|nr:lytic murein transglycosylase [Solirubrobacteraceae bacterium]
MKTVTGQVVQMQLPPGAALPAGATLISSVCPPPVTTPSVPTPVPTTSTPSTTPTTTGTGSQTTTTGGGSHTTTPSSTTPSSTTPTTTAPSPNTPGKSQRPSNHPAPAGTVGSGGSSNSSGSQNKNKKKKKTKPKSPPPQRTNGGVPTPSNPSFSFSLPGPAPIGVPNFFIDSFRIPPFLLPIYQAAGIQYNVPWQVLAAINEIETDYGRNLSVSTAGAVGWMQFLPSTWKRYGVDANGDGVADPYNPVDAIFSAARYLHAADASKNLAGAVFSYNHAGWYVQSVMLRAKLIGGMPNDLVGALTGLVEGHFPVAAPSRYADDAVEKLAKRRIKKGNAAVPINSDPNVKGVAIFAKQNSPVIAVNDGKIVKIGQNKKLGRYLMLQDATGNVYTYSNLGSIPSKYPVPKRVKVTAKQITKQLSAPITPPPTGPASAGSQQSAAIPSVSKATNEIKSAPSKAAPLSVPVAPQDGSRSSTKSQPANSQPSASQPNDQSSTIPAPLAKERLFANPRRPNSYAAGGAAQIKNTALQISNFRDYFSDVLHLGKKQYTLQPLKAGAVVVAGTILGRIGKGSTKNASHLEFMVRPAGKNAPQIDPKPILDGWKLLEATAVYRAAGVDPFFGPGAKNPSIGEILLMSKEQLQSRVLADPHVQIYACGRRDIQAGLIDRRILGVMEFLSSSGLYPTVSGLDCGHSLRAATGVDAAGATGSSIDISRINNIPVQGHQGAGSIADITIRRLLTLQGAMRPDEIVSTISYKGQSNTLSLPDHGNRIQVEFTPLFGRNNKLAAEVKS